MFHLDESGYFPRCVDFGTQGDSDDTLFLAYERFHKTLTEVVAEGKKDHASICKMGISLISAIERLHSVGLIHQNIKPDNVMTANENSHFDLALIDFGSADEYKTLFDNDTEKKHRVNELGNTFIGCKTFASLNVT